MICSEDILTCVGEIPPLPGTVISLVNVVNDPCSTVQDIVDVIKYDQAVTSQMLRICNSAFFGLSREVNSLNDAMRYLGTVKVLQMLMAVHTNAMLSKEQQGYGLAPGELWKHSVAVALASSAFADRIILGNSGLAFTAGLLHDIGKVILNEYVGKEYADIAQIVAEQKASFVEAERQVLGFSHEEIGAQLADQWKLPEAIIRCIRYHHDPSGLEPNDALVDVVYLADCVCLLFGIGLGNDELHYRADALVMERHCLNESDLEVIGAGMLSELKRVEQLFADSVPASSSKTHAQR